MPAKEKEFLEQQELQEEMSKALFSNVGITDLISKERFAKKIEEHFEKIGKRDLLINTIPISSEVEKFVETYNNIDKFEPTKEDIADSRIASDEKLSNIKRYSTSCDVEIHYVDGNPVVVFYDINPDEVELLDFDKMNGIYNAHFDSMEREALNQEQNTKNLKKLLENLEEKRKSELEHLKTVEIKEREFLKSMRSADKFPFLFVDGDNVYFWGDKKKDVRRISSMVRSVRNSNQFFLGEGMLPEGDSSPELFLDSLQKIKKQISSGKAMEFNPDYLSSALLTRLYSIDPNNLAPNKTPLWKKLLVGGLIGGFIASLAGSYFIPQEKKRQRIDQLKGVGLTDGHALSFDGNYSKYANDGWVSSSYNQTILNFARHYSLNPDLASKLFNIHSNFRWSNELFDFNSSLVETILDQIERDYRVTDKTGLAREVLSLYLELGNKVQKLSQIYTVNNATAYFGNSATLKNEIGNETLSAALTTLGENDGVNSDFNISRVHASLLKLAKCIKSILKYPKEWREGTIQADDIGYKNGVASQNETEYWDVVGKAAKYIIDKIDSGEAAYELGIPDKKLEASYRRQRLLPYALFGIDIVTGQTGGSPLKIAKHNVNPDSELGGKSPQEWLDEMTKKDYTEKTLRYQLAMMKDRVVTYPEQYWPKSHQAFMDALDIVSQEDPEAVFIIGYPRALRGSYIPWGLEPIVPMEEPSQPAYTALVARVFGKAALCVSNDYPDFGRHGSAYVKILPSTYAKIIQNGETLIPCMFGEFLYKEQLKQDHINYGGRPANPILILPDGSEEKINL